MVTTFFSKANTTIETTYSGYRGIYDTYFAKWEKIKNQIQSNLTQMAKITEDNNANMKKLRPYKNYTYVDYTKKDLSNYDNRYAIYWYRYEPGYTSDDRLYPADWRRLTTCDDFGVPSHIDVSNYGLPVYDDLVIKDGKYYFYNNGQTATIYESGNTTNETTTAAGNEETTAAEEDDETEEIFGEDDDE